MGSGATASAASSSSRGASSGNRTEQAPRRLSSSEGDFFDEDEQQATRPASKSGKFTFFLSSSTFSSLTQPKRRRGPNPCTLLSKAANFLTKNGQLAHATPVPPRSDVNELEYVSALHQCATQLGLCQDGSVSAKEISIYLKSRHGLEVSPEIVRTRVLQDGLTADHDESAATAKQESFRNSKRELDLGGNDDEDEDDDDGEGTVDAGGGTMDLVEMTAALIIPTLLHLRRQRLGNVRSDRTSVFEDVVRVVLEDVTGDDKPKRLDDDLVRDILRGFGESVLATDDNLVNEMVCAANSDVFDASALVEAVTSDVARKYDPDRDDRPSTNLQDVFQFTAFGDCHDDGKHAQSARSLESGGKGNLGQKPAEIVQQRGRDKVYRFFGCCRRHAESKGELPSAATDDDAGRDRRLSSIERTDTAEVFHRLVTGQELDYTADTYRSRVHCVFLWTSFSVFYAAYLFDGFGDSYLDCEGEDGEGKNPITCPLVGGIITPLLVICELLVIGCPFIAAGSVGNAIDGMESTVKMVLGLVVYCGFIVLFYFYEFSVPKWISSKGDSVLQGISLMLGMVVVVFQVVHMGMLALRKYFPQGTRGLTDAYFNFGNVNYEAKIKKASAHKVGLMLHNAQRVQRQMMEEKQDAARDDCDKELTFLSNYGGALTQFFKLDGVFETVGGVGWTWSRIWNGTLFSEEGIWISNRVVLGTVFQILITLATPFVAIFLFPKIEEQINPDSEGLNTRGKIALGVGASCAFLTSLAISILFVPTMVSNALKLRRGVLPSLRDELFLRYRFALDQATLLYGGMIFGCLVSALAIAMVTGGFVYILMWEKTSKFVIPFVGSCIGLVLVVLTKLIFMQCLRFTYFAAFYRKKPFAANLMFLAVECYSLGISVWFILVRAIKITFIAALYLGRIDTPIFATGVGIFGPIEIDNWPTVSIKEILVHEAHRHPYIETLGYLYMMQLRYRDGGFARRACSAWRLVFVLSLMPWLHKYRDMAKPDKDDVADGDGFDDDDDGLDDGRSVPLSAQDSLVGGASVRRLSLPKQTTSAQGGAGGGGRGGGGGHGGGSLNAPPLRNSVDRRRSAMMSMGGGRGSVMGMVSTRWRAQDLWDAPADGGGGGGGDRRGSGGLLRAAEIRGQIRRLQKELDLLESKEKPPPPGSTSSSGSSSSSSPRGGTGGDSSSDNAAGDAEWAREAKSVAFAGGALPRKAGSGRRRSGGGGGGERKRLSDSYGSFRPASPMLASVGEDESVEVPGIDVDDVAAERTSPPPRSPRSSASSSPSSRSERSQQRTWL